MMKQIGMTGTREGMTEEQKVSFHEILKNLREDHEEFHHGDCIGADAEGHKIAKKLGYHCVIHPPLVEDVRAFCEGHESWKEKSYFARNRDIVECADIMLATPVTNFETQGGTWYTINYTKKKEKPLIIIFPDGNLDIHNYEDG